MRDHFLGVSCGCGARRVVALGIMAREPRTATATLAHVALRITCQGRHRGPDEVHLCATVYGRVAPTFGGGLVWTMPLVEGGRQPSYHLRNSEGVGKQVVTDQSKG